MTGSLPPSQLVSPRTLPQALRELAARLKQADFKRCHAAGQVVLSTGIPPLDGLLPEGGFRPGTLVEWLAASPASGVDLLALLSVRSLLRDGGALVVLDPEKTFYPPAAAACGLVAQQTIVVRSKKRADVLWTLEQCLQSPGVAVCLCRLERVNSRVLRRMQLAAERGGGLGFLLRPLSARGQPAWSDMRLEVTSILPPAFSGASWARRWRVELVRSRRGNEKTAILEFDDATGVVSAIFELVAAAG